MKGPMGSPSGSAWEVKSFYLPDNYQKPGREGKSRGWSGVKIPQTLWLARDFSPFWFHSSCLQPSHMLIVLFIIGKDQSNNGSVWPRGGVDIRKIEKTSESLPVCEMRKHAVNV